jgi:hypothetical protein
MTKRHHHLLFREGAVCWSEKGTREKYPFQISQNGRGSWEGAQDTQNKKETTLDMARAFVLIFSSQ